MKRKLGGRMLDYLKKVSSILLIVLLVSVCYASKPQQKEKIPEPLFDSHVEVIIDEFRQYVKTHEWNFEATSFNDEIIELGKILKKHSVEFDDYYLAIMKFIAINPDQSYFYIIKVGVIIKGVQNDWVATWVLYEGIKEPVEEIKKIESDKLSPKQNV